MPLTATVADRRVEAWTLCEAEWIKLKREYRKLGCQMSCGQPGYPKTSPLRTQYFAHLPNTDCGLHEGGPEGPEHLRAKAILAETARAAGWTATVEYPAQDRSWIADVLIERGGLRMALEVQWSTQSGADFARRQQRYEDAGVKGRWFVAERNRANASSVPSFVISGSVEELMLEIPGGIVRQEPAQVALDDGIALLLSGTFKPRVEVKPVSALVHGALARCWRADCAKWLTLWRVIALDVDTRCGESFRYSNWFHYEEHRPDRTEYFLQNDITRAINASDLPTAIRYDTRHDRVAGYHKAMICPHCEVVFGDRYINHWNRRWETYAIPVTSRGRLPPALLEVPHVCIDRGPGQCAPAASPHADLLFESSWRARPINDEPYDAVPARGSRRKARTM